MRDWEDNKGIKELVLNAANMTSLLGTAYSPLSSPKTFEEGHV